MRPCLAERGGWKSPSLTGTDCRGEWVRATLTRASSTLDISKWVRKDVKSYCMSCMQFSLDRNKTLYLDNPKQQNVNSTAASWNGSY